MKYSALLLWHKNLVALPEDGVDGLRRAGIEAEPAAFEAAGRIEFERRGRKPCAGWADGYAKGLMGAPVGMAN
ncbi:MAG: hypothetical protein C4293_04145 [Nitrospiraceae bacterium]